MGFFKNIFNSRNWKKFKEKRLLKKVAKRIKKQDDKDYKEKQRILARAERLARKNEEEERILVRKEILENMPKNFSNKPKKKK
jgi:hypothetical protein